MPDQVENVMMIGGRPVMRFYTPEDAEISYQTEGRVTRAYSGGQVVAEYTDCGSDA